jgi:RNA polymerase sigma-70 factor (ECF subfamily)
MSVALPNSFFFSPSRTGDWSWLGLLVAMASGAPADTLSAVARTDADSDDIRQTLAGDGEAYRRIVCRHQQEIASRLQRFSRDPLVIEELVQETFVQTYFSLAKFRGDAPFIHWLHRIAVRVGYRHWTAKKAKSQTTSLEDQDIAAPPSPDDDSELLAKLLDELPPRDRLVITLMYLEDRSVQETAALTGWSKTMVKVQAFRARGKLKKMMQARGGAT